VAVVPHIWLAIAAGDAIRIPPAPAVASPTVSQMAAQAPPRPPVAASRRAISADLCNFV
jgi:hypothetical protein